MLGRVVGTGLGISVADVVGEGEGLAVAVEVEVGWVVALLVSFGDAGASVARTVAEAAGLGDAGISVGSASGSSAVDVSPAEGEVAASLARHPTVAKTKGKISRHQNTCLSRETSLLAMLYQALGHE